MKPFNTLTNNELVNLTEEQIKEYLDYVCAEEGLPLEVEEPVAPTAIKAEHDLNLCEIPSVVVSKEVAEHINKILENNPQFYKGYKDSYYTVIGVDDYHRASMKMISATSKSLADKYARENYASKKLWEEYNKAKEIYDQAVIARQEKIEEIYNQISSARSLVYNQERMLKEWDKYLSLAGNDRVVAQKFFEDRYSASEYKALFEDSE